MQNKFTDQARRVLEQAAFAAEVNGHCYIGSGAFAAWTYTGRGLPGR